MSIIVYGIIGIILILILIFIFTQTYELEKNIHYYAFYDKEQSIIMYHQQHPFYHTYESIYMSDTLKNDIFSTIDIFKNNKNILHSLRFIISGKESIGKTTLIEGIAIHFNYRIINFPKNNYSEKMIHMFFKDMSRNFPINNIILFDNIDFATIYNKNNHLYNLISEFVVKNDKNNIFIFTFNSISDIIPSFANTFHIHKHYYMESHINHIMKLISKHVKDPIKLINIKNNFLQINHKLTPGYIIPYLSFNEDFQKSLDRFFKIIKQ